MEKTVRKAVVLVSGGLDSATVLAIAREQAYETYALSVAYGQRHIVELEAARRVVARLQAKEHRVMQVNLDAIGGSALTDPAIAVPENTWGGAEDPGNGAGAGIPITYVPARNTLFLALALGWAEVIGAHDLFIGVNAVDYSGYPDCRPEFIRAFEALARLATKAGVEGADFTIHAPLLKDSKAEIIRRGMALGVDFADTISCYQADAQGRACGRCDSCHLRRAGFVEAGLPDPTHYQI